MGYININVCIEGYIKMSRVLEVLLEKNPVQYFVRHHVSEVFVRSKYDDLSLSE